MKHSDVAYDDQEITVLAEEQAALPSTAANAVSSDARSSTAPTSSAAGAPQSDFKLGFVSVPRDTVLNSWRDCWTLEQWKYFKSAKDRLFAVGGNLGCCVCKAVSG